MIIKNSKSFSLVEIVMAMVIVSLLAVIIIPKYNEHREKALWIQTNENRRAIEEAIGYYIANENKLPYPDLEVLVKDGYLRDIPPMLIGGGNSNRVTNSYNLAPGEVFGWVWAGNLFQDGFINVSIDRDKAEAVLNPNIGVDQIFIFYEMFGTPQEFR